MKDAETSEMDMQAQAGQWLVRMHEPDCTEDERADCRRWRAQSPAHEATFRRMEIIWQHSAHLGNDPAIATALREAERREAPRPRAGAARWRLALAAAAGLAGVAVVATFLLTPKEVPGVRYATALGEQQRVELSDGTAVVLDTETTLVVRYSGRERSVELDAGQAQFAVHHDTARPFVVTAGGGRVTAVGTEFAVRVDEQAATVTLFEGAVVAEGPADGPRRARSARLAPGQQLYFARDGREWATADVDLDVARAWTEGHVFASDWPLSRLVAEMNRYSRTKLRIADPAVADLRISGGFRFDDPQALARVLEHSLPVRSAQADDEILLTHR